MAHIKQNVLGVLKGKVGTLSTYTNNTGNVARIRTNATNVGESASRTQKQQTNRVRWANLVNMYKASKNWMPKAFESRKKTRSDYNQFMSINYANAKAALTKQEAAAGACVVEAFLISQGSLAPVQVSKADTRWITGLALGSLTISAATTVAEFAAALIENNANIREGMQLSMVSYQQIIDDLGTPRVICTAYEIILDTKNTEQKALDFLPEFACASVDGKLATGEDISVGAFAYVLSETVSGRTMVSTQSLIVNNEILLEQYTSEEQIEKAIASYGLSANVFLDANEAIAKKATPQPLYIEYVQGFNGYKYKAKNGRPGVFDMFGDEKDMWSTIKMSADVVPSSVSAAWFTQHDEDEHYNLTITEVNESQITTKMAEGTYTMGGVVDTFHVVVDDVEYVVDFRD